MRQSATEPAAAPRIAFDLVEEVHPSSGGFGEVVVMQASGEVDFAAGPQLRERLFARIGRAQMLVLDLSAVTFIDSMAIGVLIGAATRMREIGAGTLSVVCSSENERVLRIFDIAGVASVIALHRTVREALAASPSAAGERQPEPAVQSAAVGASPGGVPSRPGVARRYVPAQVAGQGAGAPPDPGLRQVDEIA